MLSALSSVRCKSSYSGDGCLEDTSVNLNTAQDNIATLGKKPTMSMESWVLLQGQHFDLFSTKNSYIYFTIFPRTWSIIGT